MEELGGEGCQLTSCLLTLNGPSSRGSLSGRGSPRHPGSQGYPGQFLLTVFLTVFIKTLSESSKFTHNFLLIDIFYCPSYPFQNIGLILISLRHLFFWNEYSTFINAFGLLWFLYEVTFSPICKVCKYYSFYPLFPCFFHFLTRGRYRYIL